MATGKLLENRDEVEVSRPLGQPRRAARILPAGAPRVELRRDEPAEAVELGRRDVPPGVEVDFHPRERPGDEPPECLAPLRPEEVEDGDPLREGPGILAPFHTGDLEAGDPEDGCGDLRLVPPGEPIEGEPAARRRGGRLDHLRRLVATDAPPVISGVM